MSDHISGQELARNFYVKVVQRIVNVPHSAALLGEGSEVLGYDQPRSTDHSWGPRLQIFVASDDIEGVRLEVERGLPEDFGSYPVRFYSWQTKSVRHHVEVTTLDEWLNSQLGVKSPSELTPAKWLTIPQQHLLQVKAGSVFRDDLGKLRKARTELSWYPKDVWLWMMASQWHIIGNTQPYFGRIVETSDFRGASLIVFRLVRLIMELCFLQERRYWPYLKWFGTAFSRLNIAPIIGPILDRALQSTDHHTREDNINQALMLLGAQHNTLALTEKMFPNIHSFEIGINYAVRPYPVLNAGEFANVCRNSIIDKRLYGIPTVGSIDQLTHADDLLVNFTSWPQQLEALYRADPVHKT